MAYKLVCVHPFHDPISGVSFKRGDEITEPVEVARHLVGRDNHFVKVEVPTPVPSATPVASTE